MLEDVERTVGKQSNKLDSQTLQIENKFNKFNREIKKISQTIYRLQIHGPVSSTNVGNSPSMLDFKP